MFLFSLAEFFFFADDYCSYKILRKYNCKAYLQYLQVHLKILEYNGKRSIFCHSFQKMKPIASLNIDLNISSIISWNCDEHGLQIMNPAAISNYSPNTSCPLKLNRFEPGQYLDGRPHGNTRVLLEEVLGRPVGKCSPCSLCGSP